MNRLKSPLVALLAAMILVGPVVSRFSQVDETDFYQISTPSAWEHNNQPQTQPWEIEHIFNGDPSDTSSGTRFIILDGFIILFSSETITRISSTTLEVEWEIATDFTVIGINKAVERNSGRTVLQVYGNTEESVIDATDGRFLWRSEYINFPSHIYFSESYLVNMIWNDDLSEIIVRDTDFAIIWRMSDLNSSIHMKDIIYVSSSQSVVAFDLSSGSILWEKDFADITDIKIGGNFLFVLETDAITAINVSTGAEIWMTFVDQDYAASVSDTGILALQMEGAIRVIDPESGLDFTDLPLRGYPKVELDGNVLVAFDLVGRAAIIHIPTGEVVWKQAGERADYHAYYCSYFCVLSFSSSEWVLFNRYTGAILEELLDAPNFNIIYGPDIVNLFYTETEVFGTRDTSDSIIWRHSLNAVVKHGLIQESYVVLFDRAHFVTVLDIDSGQLINRYKVPGELTEVYHSFLISKVDSSVLVSDVLSGNIVGTFDSATTSEIEITQNDRITVFSTRKRMMIFENASASLVLDTPVTNRIFDLLDDGSAILYRSTDDTVLEKMDASGNSLWITQVNPLALSITSQEQTGTVILRYRSTTWILDSNTGELLWVLPIRWSDSRDTLLIAGKQRTLYSVDGVTTVFAIIPDQHLLQHTVLRAAPSTSAVKRGTYPAGTIVIPTGKERERADGLWLEVQIDEVTGWVPHDKVIGIPPTDTATPAA